MKTIRAIIQSRKGQSIVEIALITPLLLIALVIPADFGVAFFVANITGTAAREGARIGSEMTKPGGDQDDRDFTTANADAVRDAVIQRLPNYLKNRSVTVKFYEDTVANCLETVEVTASGTYDYYLYQILRLFGATVPNNTIISRTTQMPYLWQPYTNATRCPGPPAPGSATYPNV
jgi:Flp pilus assembly protein TadG